MIIVTTCYCTWAFSRCGEGATPELRCAGFSLQWLSRRSGQALGAQASVVATCGLVVAPQELSCPEACGPGIKPMSPALAGGFLSTLPLGKSFFYIFKIALLRYS